MENSNPWLIFDKKPGQNDIILFCLHFAGGTAALYREWQQHAPSNIAICRVQLPGHGTRMAEDLLTEMVDLLDSLEQAITPWTDFPYILFGHSMGGIIAAELTLRMQQKKTLLPQCLFLSAAEPPHQRWRPACRHYSRDEFRSLVFTNGGTPKEILDNDELMDIFEPILRADYTLLETWAPQPVRPIHIPIIAFAGTDDEVVPKEVVAEWQCFAASDWCIKHMPGGHFFIQSHTDLVRNSIFTTLEMYRGRSSNERIHESI